jgi:hypothetical protein
MRCNHRRIRVQLCFVVKCKMCVNLWLMIIDYRYRYRFVLQYIIYLYSSYIEGFLAAKSRICGIQLSKPVLPFLDDRIRSADDGCC